MKDASGRSKGCGIVEYRTPVEAQEAINTLLDTELKGRLIFVREDREAAGVFRAVPVHAPGPPAKSRAVGDLLCSEAALRCS